MGDAARAVAAHDPALAERLQELRKPATLGGKREGAGRKVVFKGRRVKFATKVTELARDLITQAKADLVAEHGTAATDAAAVEWLIRKATRTPMDAYKNEKGRVVRG